MQGKLNMSVFERTREIGTLRALGWRRRRVLWMVLQESLAPALMGALVGMTFGGIERHAAPGSALG